MKSIILSSFALLVLGATLGAPNAKATWHQFSGGGAWGQAHWERMVDYEDASGARQYWCISGGNQCAKYDWGVDEAIASPTSPSGYPSATWGFNAIVACATGTSTSLPSDFPSTSSGIAVYNHSNSFPTP